MKIFLDTNIFPEFIDRRVTTGSGHFVTVTKYPDPDVTKPPGGGFKMGSDVYGLPSRETYPDSQK